MHRTFLRTYSIIISICILISSGVGQIKPVAEVDVSKCWDYPANGAVARAIGVDGNRVYVGFAGAKVEALSFEGEKVWASELGGEIASNILTSDASLFVITSAISGTNGSSSVLRSLSKETGVTNWTLKMPDANRHFIATSKGLVFVVSGNGTIQAIDPANGSIKWKRELAAGFVAEPVFLGDIVTVAATGNQIFTVSLLTGEVESMLKVQFGVTALSQFAGGGVVVGDERGNVTVFIGASDKPYWKFKSGGEISALMPIGDDILTASHDNFVYLLAGRNGGIVWKRRLAGRVAHAVNVMDKFVMTSSFEEHGAVFAAISNGKVSGQILLGNEESIIARPLVSTGSIFFATTEAIYSYNLSGCIRSKEGGPGR